MISLVKLEIFVGKRNSISVRSATYNKVRAYCIKNGITASGLIEKLIAEALKNFEPSAVIVPVVLAPSAVRSSLRSPEALAADKIFTF